MTQWPEEVSFGLDNFSSAAQLFSLVKSVYQREEAAALTLEKNVDDSEVLRSLRGRIRGAIASPSPSSETLANALISYALSVLSADVSNKVSLKPTRGKVMTVESTHPYNDNMVRQPTFVPPYTHQISQYMFVTALSVCHCYRTSLGPSVCPEPCG